MTLPTLIVNPPQLSSASSALSSASDSLPTELPKFSVAGADPLSMAISTGAVQVEMPMLALPGIKTKATTTARNIGSAAQRYTATDEAMAAKIAGFPAGEPTVAQNALSATGAAAPAVGAGAAVQAAAGAAPATAAAAGMGSGTAAGGAAGAGATAGAGAVSGGGLSQMMGTPMQLAQQAAQAPAQLAGSVASAPQGLMQGAQGAVQQITQMTGQLGKSDNPDDRGLQSGRPADDSREGEDAHGGRAPLEPTSAREVPAEQTRSAAPI